MKFMEKQSFTLLPIHIELLRNAYVSWNTSEYGAPCICPKRPYGNGDVVGDVAPMLGITPVPTDDGETHWPPGTADTVNCIHRELETALQVVLATGSFEPGDYTADAYARNWESDSIKTPRLLIDVDDDLGFRLFADADCPTLAEVMMPEVKVAVERLLEGRDGDTISLTLKRVDMTDEEVAAAPVT